MELKNGYIQTEVGVIPEDWEVKKLGDVLKLQRGFDLPHRYRVPGPVPIVSSAGVCGTHNEFLAESPGVVTGRYGTIGEVFYVETNYWPLNTTLFVKSFKNNLPLYTFHLLKTIDFKTHSGKSGVPGVNRNDLHEILIPHPPTEAEQTAIATALSDADALISHLETLIAKKRAIKQGAMQQLLKPKEERVVKKLEEVARFYKGKGLPKSHLDEFGKFKCIHYGELFTKYKELINTIYSHTDINSNSFLSVSNDVLMPTSDVTPNGLAKASCLKEDNVILGGDILIIRTPDSLINGVFLSYFITYDKEQVMRLVSGSTVYHLYGSDMARFEVRLPCIAQQTHIAQILSDMDVEIAGLEQKLAKYKRLKQGMMQELLTGRTRLI